MRRRFWLGFLPLALGCRGDLIDLTLPGPNQPPTTITPALAFRFGGPGADLVTDMVSDPAGNGYVAGTFTGAANFDPGTGVTARNSLGATDGFLAKYTATGALAWVDRLGGTGAERVNSLARDAAGNLYIGGGFEGSANFDPASSNVLTSAGGEDGFVAKYSSDGALVWARRFGGPSSDEVTGVAVDAGGNVYAVGVFSGQANALPTPGPTIPSNGSATDGFLLALGPDGSIAWAIPMGGPQDDAARAVAVSSSGSVTVAGTFRGAADFSRNSTPTPLTALGGADIFLANYSAAGTIQWVHEIGGVNDESLPIGGLARDAQNGLVLVGGFSGSVDFDPGAGTAAHTSLGTQDLFLARYDANGNFLSVVTLGSQAGGTITGVRALADPDGSALLTGSFSGPLDFDPGPGITSLVSYGTGGATDAFVARYTPAGALAWVSRFGEVTSLSERTNSGTALALDAQDNVIVAGRFFGSPDFDPGATAFRLTSVGDADGFVVKLTPAGALAPRP